MEAEAGERGLCERLAFMGPRRSTTSELRSRSHSGGEVTVVFVSTGSVDSTSDSDDWPTDGRYHLPVC